MIIIKQPRENVIKDHINIIAIIYNNKNNNKEIKVVNE